MPLRQEVEPAEVGLDPGGLASLDRHLARHVDGGGLAGYLLSIARHGRVAHLSTYGVRDLDAGLPVRTDTLWRIYSMTKPVTSVAALMLHEQGRFDLDDPVERYLPGFAEPRVYAGGEGPALSTRPAGGPIRIRHLLTHTAGMTLADFRTHPVDAAYRRAGLGGGALPEGTDLAGLCDLYATLPLRFEPGTEWNYSIATNIVGRLVEVLSGQPFEAFLAERVLGPLGMADTGFFLDAERSARLAPLYGPGEGGRATPLPGVAAPLTRPALVSPSGGLLSTAEDYHRFMELLRRRGELDGVRLLEPATVDLMAANHLPGGADLRAFASPVPAGADSFVDNAVGFAGRGFGLGVAVTVDPAARGRSRGAGAYGWSGSASTTFWIDPREDLTVQFLTHLVPSGTYPLLPDLERMVYGALDPRS